MAFGFGIAKGMLHTLSHLAKRPDTIMYPEEQMEMPLYTRGRPRLVYEVNNGELRCTACGACALACPVDVIKIEQHPNPAGKGKILDRFDIDMAGCIECALCVESCPFKAITMAPDFEMAATNDRTQDLVFDMYQLRLAGTPDVDAAMQHILGVKRGAAGQASAAAPKAQAAPATAGGRPTAPTSPAAAAPPVANVAPTESAVKAAATAAEPTPASPAPAPAAAAPAAPAAAAPANYDPLTISDEDLAKLPAVDRAKVYRARLQASGFQPPKKA